MILVQKQPSMLFPASTLHHRRHPSAPPAVVVVQPTRTPGLLSLSKPQQQRHQPQQRTPRAQPALKSPKLQAPVVAAPVTPSPASRGRQSKDKAVPAPRSNSLSARRHAHRQPSPPFPSHAEDPTTPTKPQPSAPNSSNSDPFFVPATSPTLSTRPSGKLARRRQQYQQQASIFTPSKVYPSTKPVPIPSNATQPTAAKPLSRSVPTARPTKRTSAAATRPPLLPPWDFPICDDMTDAGDLSDAAPSSPVTPTRRRPAKPLAFASVPPPTKSRTRNHRRAPSDSGMVFHMSSDESGPEGTMTTDRDEELKALVRGMTMSSLRTVRTPPAVQEAQQTPQGYFASSMFQNSPSPEELPDPLFI